MKKYLKQLFCKHKFNCDSQIRVIRCEKCKKEYGISEFKSLYK